MPLRILLLSILIVLFISCTEDDSELIEYVDTEMAEYFERFEVEAQLRGRSIDISEMKISAYQVDLSGDVAGQCASLVNGSKEVRVDPDFWKTANDLEKEFVIFHELGHCALDRGHVDTKNRNGTCTSMMNSGLGECTNIYTQNTREEYIDELFFQ